MEVRHVLKQTGHEPYLAGVPQSDVLAVVAGEWRILSFALLDVADQLTRAEDVFTGPVA